MKKEVKEIIQNEIEQSSLDYLKKGTIAGLNVSVFTADESLAYFQAGHADVAKKKAIQKNTIFRLYSMTKPITAFAIMLLEEDGKLSLENPLSKYFPSFAKTEVLEEGASRPSTKEIRICDLMTMQSGLPYPGDSPSGRVIANVYERIPLDKEDVSDETVNIIDAFSKAPLLFEAGDGWEYGVSADILGAVVEKASAMHFDAFLEERIFAPLEMLDSGFYLKNAKEDRLAKTYHLVDGKLIEFETSNLAISWKMEHKPAFLSGGAGLVSTIEDYQKFCQMLLAKGSYNNKRIAKESTVQAFMSPQLSGKSLDEYWEKFRLTEYQYGNLCRQKYVTENGGTKLIDFGWDGWLGCSMGVYPDDGFAVLVMLQKVNGGDESIQSEIKSKVYKILTKNC